ncbi:MAG: hypothetical protein JXA21_14260 [Anaerolineae bacterium]|nr:hypothetical protein [Anaerolineae bacterium]
MKLDPLQWLPYLALLSTVQIFSQGSMALLKWFWLKRLGLSDAERRQVFSTRKGFDLQALLAKYPEVRIRRVDSFCRKGHHFLSGMLYILITQLVIKDLFLIVPTIIIQSFINLGFLLIAYRSDRVVGLGGLFFGGLARIRDGIYGRLNLVIALLGLCVQYIVVSALAIWVMLPLTGNEQALIVGLINFIYYPQVIGDAAGEIIGGTWGKHTIKVKGIGEINRKSWLGTGAVFVSSLVSLALHISGSRLPSSYLLLAFVISLSSTVFELISPRSSDNATIAISNALWCTAWLALMR